MNRSFLWFLIATALLVPAVLLNDGPGLLRQSALGLVNVLFLLLFVRRSAVPVRQIVIAVIVATIGEVVLSVGWELYSYQYFLIPLYVPAGHGLLYALAVESARQPVLVQRASWITASVLLMGTAVACWTLATGGDVWGACLWLVALALIARSQHRLVLSASVVFTMLLEWAGTALGNWQWAAVVPFLGLRSANPPSGVGIFYLILDVVVVLIAGNARGWTAVAPAAALTGACREPFPVPASGRE